MNNNILEYIADDLLSILPLLHKKLMRPDCSSVKDLPPSHLQVIILLNDMGVLSVSELGKRLCISRPNMTPLIDKLISEGMVERIPHESDRRITNIALTDTGHDFLNKHKQMIIRSFKERIAILSEEDREKFLQLLKDLKELIHKID